MFIPRIYYPHPLQTGELITFDKEISHYLAQVLRLKNDFSIILFNGMGGEYHANFFLDRKKSQASILSFDNVSRESVLKLHLGQGLARGDRMDYAIQKATELGVTSITPLITKFCSVKLAEERTPKRLLHWQNIAISASEQSGRTQVPIIHPPLPLDQWIQQSFEGLSLLFELNSDLSLNKIEPENTIRLAIGPESGWDESEALLMIAQGFKACSLGPRILRTETAGVAAISILQGVFGDLC